MSRYHKIANGFLWMKVEKTDPAYTKEFNRGGGFRGTSINSTWLAKRATEVFGPVGIGWGVEVVDETLMEGHVFNIETGERTIIHKIRIRLWYVLDEKKGEITHYGQTTFVGSNKYGAFTDEEAPKKSLTDATTKALSMLGFGGDIFMGMYDDPGYREEVGAKAALDRADDKDAERAKQAVEYREWKQKHIEMLSTAATEAELKTLFALVMRKMKRHSDDAGQREADAAHKKAKRRLERKDDDTASA